MREAESYRGVSLILAYSQCIAHGIDMARGMSHQKEIVQCGLWPLYRYDPRLAQPGSQPFRLDSRKPTIRFEDFYQTEARFAQTMSGDTPEARQMLAQAQQDIDDQWHLYEQMATLDRQLTTNGTAQTSQVENP